MSTTLDLPPSRVEQQISRRPFLIRVAEWTKLGTPAEPLDVEQPRRAGAPAVLLSLIIAVCGAIFGLKCAIGFQELWSKGSGLPLVIFDYRLPLWQSIPLALGRTWLCCVEDFAVGIALLLVGAVVLKLVSLRSFRERFPTLNLVCRGLFWTVAYVAAVFAIGLMISDMYLFFKVDHFLDQKKILMAGNLFSMEKSVQDEVTLPRKLLLVMLPLGVISLQLALVQLFPRFWRTLAYYLCRPLAITAGLVTFVAMTWWVQTPGQAFDRPDYGAFMHNPHLYLAESYLPGPVRIFLGEWDIKEVKIGQNEVPDFLPDHPGLGDLKLDKDKRPKNIIFIVMESGGSHWMHDYGAVWETTPNLRQIVEKDKKGILFENTYAISDHTIASAIALFGSMNNHDCENCAVYAARDWPGPNRDFPVPAASTWLHNKGYRTYFMGAGGKSVWEGYKNIARAFLPYGFDIAKDGYKHWGKEKPDWGFKEDEHDDNSLFADAYRCLDDAKQKDKPFFLMMWNYDTHWKYTDGEGPEWDESKFPPMVQKDPERIAQFNRYLKAIWRLDRLIGKLYTDLEKRGIAEDTLIVLTGDHGQSFGHHGIWTHGYKLYEEEVRVPLIFINKNLGAYAADHKCGPRSDILCSHLDIWPTIMDVCGLDCNKKWQGRSVFTTKLDPAKRHAYLWVGGLAAIREGDYKYIWDKEDKELYLFNIKNDPAEQNNLLKQNPDKFNSIKDRLHDELHKWMGWQAEWNQNLLEKGKRD